MSQGTMVDFLSHVPDAEASSARAFSTKRQNKKLWYVDIAH